MSRNFLQEIHDLYDNQNYSVDSNGCHIVTNVKPNRDGYFLHQRNHEGKKYQFLIHRALYCFYHNLPYNGSFEVRHLCPIGHNPSCVNVQHLSHGSHRDNSRDRRTQDCYPESLWLEKIFPEYEKGLNTYELSHLYGPTHSSISEAIRGKYSPYLLDQYESKVGHKLTPRVKGTRPKSPSLQDRIYIIHQLVFGLKAPQELSSDFGLDITSIRKIRRGYGKNQQSSSLHLHPVLKRYSLIAAASSIYR